MIDSEQIETKFYQAVR